jgi:hypothetical protein
VHILLPKTYVDIPSNIPVFFLAGPVRGGDDWQVRCIKLLDEKLNGKDFYVAIPYYVDILPKDHIAVIGRAAGDENYFPRQLNWERHYLDLASTQGAIIFWLPEESKVNPRVGGGPYATDTRGELGEWRGRMVYDKLLAVVVGGEEGFEGFDVLKRNFKFVAGDEFKIYSTLEDTVAAAVEKIQ